MVVERHSECYVRHVASFACVCVLLVRCMDMYDFKDMTIREKQEQWRVGIILSIAHGRGPRAKHLHFRFVLPKTSS